MANANKPSGLTPVKYISGADWDGRGSVYSVATANATILSPGDTVTLDGSADVTGKYPGIVRHTPGAGLCGVLLGIGLNPNGPYINPNDLTALQKPASVVPVYYALVCDSSDVIFEAQEDGTGGALAPVDVGLNVNLIYANPATGVVVSGVLINNTTKNTTNTLDVKILRASPRVDNALGAFCKWLVLINNHRLAPNTTGV